MTKKIAIVGTCPSSRGLALELPPDWEVWVCSPGNDGFPRVDVWFELHCDLDYYTEGKAWFRYLDWLNLQHFPVYAQRVDLIPRAKLFPHEQLVNEFSHFFFTSQPAWMLAFAISQGATDIGLFGLDMAARSEYSHQKPAILHFALMAQQRGIKVYAPPESDVLCPPPLYGYSYNSPVGRKLRVRQLEVEAHIADMDRQIRELELKRQHYRGVRDENDWAQQTWTGGLYREQGEVLHVAPKPYLVSDKES